MLFVSLFAFKLLVLFFVYKSVCTIIASYHEINQVYLFFKYGRSIFTQFAFTIKSWVFYEHAHRNDLVHELVSVTTTVTSGTWVWVGVRVWGLCVYIYMYGAYTPNRVRNSLTLFTLILCKVSAPAEKETEKRNTWTQEPFSLASNRAILIAYLCTTGIYNST